MIWLLRSKGASPFYYFFKEHDREKKNSPEVLFINFFFSIKNSHFPIKNLPELNKKSFLLHVNFCNIFAFLFIKWEVIKQTKIKLILIIYLDFFILYGLTVGFDIISVTDQDDAGGRSLSSPPLVKASGEATHWWGQQFNKNAMHTPSLTNQISR